VSTAELLLERSRPHCARRLSGRERRVEAVLAALVVAVGVVLALTLQSGRPFSAAAVGVCVVAYAAAVRVPLYVGGGSAMPTQLVLVPTLFVLPLPLVPLVVVAGCCLAAAIEVATTSEHPERLLTAVGDAGYAIAPAAVLAAAGEPAPDIGGSWPILLGAFAAQCALDAVLSVGREWLGRSIRPAAQLSVMATVYGVDALALPLGVLISEHASGMPVAVIAVLPLILLLAGVARDRNRHLGEALDRLDDLTRERERLRAAIHRIGRSLERTLDRRRMLEVALSTAVDGVAAAAGHATLDGPSARCRVSVGVLADVEAQQLLEDVEAAALESRRPVGLTRAGWVALALPLRPRGDGDGAMGSLAVCSAGTAFSRDDEDLLAYLAAQTVASAESIEMHERLHREATVDELTGLANHRRFQEALESEVERSRRTEAPLSLVLIDVDDFKRVNDTYGHQIGDEVLRAVGTVMRQRCRITDQPARYGGEEMAVVLPATDAAGAHAMAEDLRMAIAGIAVPAGGRTLRVTASFGVAVLTAGLLDRHALIAAADAALYDAKRSGKNRTVVAAERVVAGALTVG
jgi:diguanylate cyclase (GGDEF)-like protein